MGPGRNTEKKSYPPSGSKNWEKVISSGQTNKGNKAEKLNISLYVQNYFNKNDKVKLNYYWSNIG